MSRPPDRRGGFLCRDVLFPANGLGPGGLEDTGAPCRVGGEAGTDDRPHVQLIPLELIAAGGPGDGMKNLADLVAVDAGHAVWIDVRGLDWPAGRIKPLAGADELDRVRDARFGLY